VSEPYEADIERIIAATRERGWHLEVNADPDRIDLMDIHAQAAKSPGVKVAILSDPHATSGWQYMLQRRSGASRLA
jgi:DNA polymerase (family 10)